MAPPSSAAPPPATALRPSASGFRPLAPASVLLPLSDVATLAVVARRAVARVSTPEKKVAVAGGDVKEVVVEEVEKAPLEESNNFEEEELEEELEPEEEEKEVLDQDHMAIDDKEAVKSTALHQGNGQGLEPPTKGEGKFSTNFTFFLEELFLSCYSNWFSKSLLFMLFQEMLHHLNPLDCRNVLLSAQMALNLPLVVSLDSRVLVSTSTDGSARIWKTDEGLPFVNLTRSSDEKIECCHFSRDGMKHSCFAQLQKRKP